MVAGRQLGWRTARPVVVCAGRGRPGSMGVPPERRTRAFGEQLHHVSTVHEVLKGRILRVDCKVLPFCPEVAFTNFYGSNVPAERRELEVALEKSYTPWTILLGDFNAITQSSDCKGQTPGHVKHLKWPWLIHKESVGTLQDLVQNPRKEPIMTHDGKGTTS